MAELREFQTEHKQAILKLMFYNTIISFAFYCEFFFFAVISCTVRLTFCDSGGSTGQKTIASQNTQIYVTPFVTL